MNSVVITGVSTGIGKAIATVLINSGFQVFGSVRKTADAQNLSDVFGARFTPLVFDVSDAAAVQAAAKQVEQALAGRTLAALVNNAGIAVFGPLAHLPISEFRRQLEINLVAPLVVTQAFLPLLGMDRSRTGKPGRIVNISSVGGKLAAPFLGPYTASKFGLEGSSDSLRRELMLYGIDVILVEPGAVATPIWEKAGQADTSLYDATEYAPALRRYGDFMLKEGRAGLPPQRIGQVVAEALLARRPKTRYAVVPKALFGWIIPRLLADRVLDRVFARNLGLVPPKAAR